MSEDVSQAHFEIGLAFEQREILSCTRSRSPNHNMDIAVNSTGRNASYRIFLQVEAYLAYNLDIVGSVIDSSCTRLASIETQLAAPAAASGKRRRTLRSTRVRLSKKLCQRRMETEVLACALDEVRS